MNQEVVRVWMTRKPEAAKANGQTRTQDAEVPHSSSRLLKKAVSACKYEPALPSRDQRERSTNTGKGSKRQSDVEAQQAVFMLFSTRLGLAVAIVLGIASIPLF
jgi:hypothetical protein